MSARSEIFRRLLDPRRDIDSECGHPTDPVDSFLYQQLIDRDPIAKRVNELYPRECWRVSPTIYEDEEEGCETDFERTLDEFPKTLAGDCDWYEDDEGNALWELALRADIEAGKGQYGILYWGLSDNDDVSQPVNFNCKPDVLYIRPLPEYMAPVSQFDNNKKSRRYGMPLTYSVNTYSPLDTTITGIGVPMQNFNVHHTRVTHIPSEVTTNDVFGVPRLRSVLNRILDLKKLYGGSAEMYWKGAFPGISIETQPQMGGEVPIDKTEMRDMMEQYFNGLQRYMALMGLSAKMLSPTVVDPSMQIKAHLEAICISLGVPMRIFMGSERGELSSAQDTTEWADRIRARQKYYVNYRILRPMVNMLIRLGAVCKPKSFRINWPDVAAPSKLERAQYAASIMQSLTAMSQGADTYIAPLDFWTRLLDMPFEEAEAIVCGAQEHASDSQEQDIALQTSLIDKGLKADPTDPEQNPFNGVAKPNKAPF